MTDEYTTAELVRNLLSRLPHHDCGFYLEHNPHKDVYDSVQEWRDGDMDYWVSSTQREAAIEANDFWVVQWYPDTPIGCHFLAAHDLAVLLDAIRPDSEAQP